MERQDGRARSTPVLRAIRFRRSTYRRRANRHDAWFLEALLARPDTSLDLLPGGKARAAKLIDLQIGAGDARQTITLWAVTGIGTSPLAIWADSNSKFFALTVGLAWLPEAYAGEQKKIEDAQASAMTAQAPDKFYGTFNPAWLPASIREAHKLGLLWSSALSPTKAALAFALLSLSPV